MRVWPFEVRRQSGDYLLAIYRLLNISVCTCMLFTFPNTEDQFQQSCDIIGLFGKNVSKSLGWLYHFDTLGKSRPMGGKTQQDPGARIQSGTFWCVMLCHEHEAPTKLLWHKKRYVTNTGPQLTSFGAKTVTWRTPGPDRPTLMQKVLRNKHGALTDLLWCKNRYVTNTGPRPTSFDVKNVTWQTWGPDRPPLMQKTLHDKHGALTGLLWCKKRYVTNTGPKLTYFGAKTVTWQTWGPDRPPLMQKTLYDKHRALTDLLWCKKHYVTNTGPKLTFYMFRYYGKRHYPCIMASRFTGIH